MINQQCAGELKCNNLMVVTMSEEKVIEKDGLQIRLVPICKF